MLLLLIAVLLARPAASDREDAQALLLRVIDNQEQNDALQRQYAYRENVMTEYLGADGKIDRRESETHDITPSLLGEYRRLVARNDRPLSVPEERREEEKLQRHLAKQSQLPPGEREKAASKATRRTDRFRTRLRESLEVYDFTPLADEKVEGRPVQVFRFAPRPGYRPHSRATSVLSKLEGTIWIDPDQAQIAKLHVVFRESLKFAAGIFGSVSEGSEAVASQTRVNDEVWLLDEIEVRIRARFYFLKRYNRVITSSYSDYRRFNVTTEESGFKKLPGR
jgi:hypothetical protein